MIELASSLSGFVPAGPDLLAKRELLRRVDTKFVIPQSALPKILPELAPHYALLGKGDAPGSQYRTLYFDTDDFRCFHDHRRGRRLRDKIRIRHYDDRRLTYLEVKARRSATHTDKSRLKITYGQNTFDDAALVFLRKHSIVPPEQLRPVLWIDYRRVMLFGIHRDERCSFDVNLIVANADRSHTSSALSRLTFVEVKQPSFDLAAPIMRVLLDAHYRPRSASKYVLSVISEHPTIRANRFLPDVRSLQRIAA